MKMKLSFDTKEEVEGGSQCTDSMKEGRLDVCRGALEIIFPSCLRDTHARRADLKEQSKRSARIDDSCDLRGVLWKPGIS